MLRLGRKGRVIGRGGSLAVLVVGLVGDEIRRQRRKCDLERLANAGEMRLELSEHEVREVLGDAPDDRLDPFDDESSHHERPRSRSR